MDKRIDTIISMSDDMLDHMTTLKQLAEVIQSFDDVQSQTILKQAIEEAYRLHKRILIDI